MTSNQNTLPRVACQMTTCQMRNEIIKDDTLRRVREESSKHHCQSTRYHLSHDAWLILSFHCLCLEFICSQTMEEKTISMFCFILCTTYNFTVHTVIRITVVSTHTHSLCVLDGSEMRITYPSLERKISSGYDCLCNIDMSE